MSGATFGCHSQGMLQASSVLVEARDTAKHPAMYSVLERGRLQWQSISDRAVEAETHGLELGSVPGCGLWQKSRRLDRHREGGA